MTLIIGVMTSRCDVIVVYATDIITHYYIMYLYELYNTRVIYAYAGEANRPREFVIVPTTLYGHETHE